nr:hypothetical protein GCM10025699_32540 [Microbacterium flavescens]
MGSKELVALLPLLLGLGPGDVVVHPRAAYPSYDVGARLVGATPVAADDPAEWPAATRLVWLNSPGNPDGRVLDVGELGRAVARARELGAVLASDECYAELGWQAPWDAEPIPSALDPRATGGSTDGVLSVYSLSKQSNLAGYRAAFLAGDPQIVARLLTARKHLGLMLPAPVQAAMIAALGDDAHVAAQKDLYRARRGSSSRRSRPRASTSTPARPASICGPRRAATRGTVSGGSPTSASSPGPATSTARTSRSTSGSRSPRPTSAWRRRRGGSPRFREDSSIGCRGPLAVSAVGVRAH